MVAFTNNIKTAALMAGLVFLFMFVGNLMGGMQYVIGFGIFAVIMNVGAWWFSDTIAIKSMRGQPVEPGDSTGLYEMVEELSARAKLPMPKVYICPHDAPNAFATGRSPRKAAVAVTHGALRLLNRQEMEGVIGHELAHIKNRDTLTSTI
ncbi:MAG: M48 family metalloprotease, partial [Planctomycetota bacterium]